MGNIQQPAKRTYSNVRQSIETDTIEPPAKRSKLSEGASRVSETVTTPSVEKEGAERESRMGSEEAESEIRDAQTSVSIPKSVNDVQTMANDEVRLSIDPRTQDALSSPARGTPIAPLLQDNLLEQRASYMSITQRIQRGSDSEPPWRAALSDYLLRKVDHARSLLTVIGHGRTEQRAIDMHLCNLFQNNPAIADIIRSIDTAVISSSMSRSHPYKCVWSILYSCVSSTPRRSCDCHKSIPEDWDVSNSFAVAESNMSVASTRVSCQRTTMVAFHEDMT